jgi:hypothetical protein
MAVAQDLVVYAGHSCCGHVLQLSLDGSRLGGLGLARNGALGFAEVCGVCVCVL